MPNNVVDTWPNLMSTCSSQHIQKLHIPPPTVKRHVNSPQHSNPNKHIRFYTLINAGTQTLDPRYNIPRLATPTHMSATPCTCLAKLRHSILLLCVTRAPNDNGLTPYPTPLKTIQSIELTYFAMLISHRHYLREIQQIQPTNTKHTEV